MRELFLKLFEQSHFNTGISITPFSLSHIVYLILIAGGIVLGAYLFRKDREADLSAPGLFLDNNINCHGATPLMLSQVYFQRYRRRRQP